MGLYNFRKVDISKQDGKRKIIDTFINAIFVYDDSFKIVYNGNGKEETISLEELESSTLFSQGAPCPKSFENSGFSGFSFAFRNRFFIGRRIVEIVDFCIIITFQGSASAVVFY